MKTTRIAALAALTPLFAGWSSCEQSLNKDPSFDAWCGDHLCDWRTDAGMARQAPTWHEADHGVELAGDPAQISQLITAHSSCIRFEAMTDLGTDASVTLALDFGDDGMPEFQSPIPATHWETVQFTVTPPTARTPLRVILRKTGAGRAVLAHMRLLSVDGCSDPPVAYLNRPAGMACEMNTECKSGRCAPGIFPYYTGSTQLRTCGECELDSDCKPGQVCGVAATSDSMYAACRPPAEGHLGARCLTDANCQSGVCCAWVCSACCDISSCPGGQSCEEVPVDAAYLKLFSWVFRPKLCSPGKHLGEKGGPCVANVDCASGSCIGGGSLNMCWSDGRTCGSAADCVAGDMVSASQSACVPIGIADGRCQ